MTIDATPATLVEVSLTLVASFDAASFDEAKRSDLAQSLRFELGCYEPECVIVLRVPAGSLRVTAVLTIPDSAAAADATAAAVAAVAAAIAAMRRHRWRCGRLLRLFVLRQKPQILRPGMGLR